MKHPDKDPSWRETECHNCGQIRWETLKEPGATVEDVLQFCAQRLEGFQRGELSCELNRRAIRHIVCALSALDERTRDRKIRGVEGTMEP